MSRKVRWVLLIAAWVALDVVAVLLFVHFSGPRVSVSTYKRLHNGMTLEEVEKHLGTGHYPWNATRFFAHTDEIPEVWWGSDMVGPIAIYVWFDEDGRVKDTMLSRRPQTRFQQILEEIGL